MWAWMWICLIAALLLLPLDFWQIRRLQGRLREGDGAGTIQACKALARSGAVTTAGMFGAEFLGRRLAHPETAVWLDLPGALTRVGLFPAVAAVCCYVFYKRGKALSG